MGGLFRFCFSKISSRLMIDMDIVMNRVQACNWRASSAFLANPMKVLIDQGQVEEARATLQKLEANIGLILKGKDEIIDEVIICLISGGHVLIEDLPGVGKTTLAYCLAKSIDCSFSRIQFTSDLLPGDVTGV